MKRATKSAVKLVVLENDDRISAETEEIQNRIRERAFQLSQEREHAGREMDDWLTAESEIISVAQPLLIPARLRAPARFLGNPMGFNPWRYRAGAITTGRSPLFVTVCGRAVTERRELFPLCWWLLLHRHRRPHRRMWRKRKC